MFHVPTTLIVLVNKEIIIREGISKLNHPSFCLAEPKSFDCAFRVLPSPKVIVMVDLRMILV